MAVIYSILVHLFYMIVLLISPFNKKARLWIKGRIKWRKKMGQWNSKSSPVYWFHAASLGEFEQGRPVIEELKRRIPSCTIILTFFSPSGYEIRKNYKVADKILYLPLDTHYNARHFIDLINPNGVFFIKYEYWFFYLNYLKKRHIPVYLISGIFRKNHVFFRSYGFWFRKFLRSFKHLFVQDAESVYRLNEIGIKRCSVSGDTRFDRVVEIAKGAKNIKYIEEFKEGINFCLVAGSTWPADEKILSEYINSAPSYEKFIIAPHEIEEKHLNRIKQSIERPCVFYSEAASFRLSEVQVLIIDNIGMLSSLYRYANIAYIGGGFGKGIHNILEAAVYGIPVLYGPNYSKFKEAVDLIKSRAAFSINSSDELHQLMNYFSAHPEEFTKISANASDYVFQNTGATKKILDSVLRSPSDTSSGP